MSARTITRDPGRHRGAVPGGCAPALATRARITSFTTTSTDSQAGGHPDLDTTFTLAEPGVHEAAKNVIFNAPEGLFGNINAITNCTPAEFALDKCPSELPGRA